MNKKHLLPARSELVEGLAKYTAMVRQAHHERSPNGLMIEEASAGKLLQLQFLSSL